MNDYGNENCGEASVWRSRYFNLLKILEPVPAAVDTLSQASLTGPEVEAFDTLDGVRHVLLQVTGNPGVGTVGVT